VREDRAGEPDLAVAHRHLDGVRMRDVAPEHGAHPAGEGFVIDRPPPQDSAAHGLYSHGTVAGIAQRHVVRIAYAPRYMLGLVACPDAATPPALRVQKIHGERTRGSGEKNPVHSGLLGKKTATARV